MAYKILLTANSFSNSTPVSGSYIVPTGKTTVISKIVIYCDLSNNGALPNFRLWSINPGDPYGQSTLASNILNKNETFEMTGGITLAAGQGIGYHLDSNVQGDYLYLTIFGDESDA